MKIKNILPRSKKNPKKAKIKNRKLLIKLVVSEIQNWNWKRIYYYYYWKRCWVWEEEEEEEGAWNQKSHERKSKTILNIKKTKAKNQNNLFCNWQTYTKHTNTYMYGTRNYILYCIVFGILLFERKQKRKEKKLCYYVKLCVKITWK